MVKVGVLNITMSMLSNLSSWKTVVSSADDESGIRYTSLIMSVFSATLMLGRLL
jgi:hypothetical protein